MSEVRCNRCRSLLFKASADARGVVEAFCKRCKMPRTIRLGGNSLDADAQGLSRKARTVHPADSPLLRRDFNQDSREGLGNAEQFRT